MTSLEPRPIRRNKITRLPCSGCHRYLITTNLDRYAECRSIRRQSEDSLVEGRFLPHMSDDRASKRSLSADRTQLCRTWAPASCAGIQYCDHIPLYRQSQIYARSGVELDRATLA